MVKETSHQVNILIQGGHLCNPAPFVSEIVPSHDRRLFITRFVFHSASHIPLLISIIPFVSRNNIEPCNYVLKHSKIYQNHRRSGKIRLITKQYYV